MFKILNYRFNILILYFIYLLFYLLFLYYLKYKKCHNIKIMKKVYQNIFLDCIDASILKMYIIL